LRALRAEGFEVNQMSVRFRLLDRMIARQY
jgi:hypothetical protein